MNEDERRIGNELGLKYYFNCSVEEYEKRKQALIQSKAIGKIIDIAYDRTGKLTTKEKALYFKDGIEVSKFMYAFNQPKQNIIDLSEVSDEELLSEINRRLHKELIK